MIVSIFYHCFPGAAQHAMMRRRPGIVTSSEPVTILDQRCTATALPHPGNRLLLFLPFDGIRMSQLEDLLRDLVVANRILANEDVVDAYGHISVRHPDNPKRFFMARSLAPE